IRDLNVTGVQTCALPISAGERQQYIISSVLREQRDISSVFQGQSARSDRKTVRFHRTGYGQSCAVRFSDQPHFREFCRDGVLVRSEERRVGKEWVSRAGR